MAVTKTEIIANGATETASADFDVTSGASATVFLKNFDGDRDPTALVRIKASSGEYVTIGRLTAGEPCLQISGPGTFNVLRRACLDAFGVESST
jgi:hypothetical protein